MLDCNYWSGQLTNSRLFHTWTISGQLDQDNVRTRLFTHATNLRRFSMYVFTHVGKTLGDKDKQWQRLSSRLQTTSYSMNDISAVYLG